MKYILSLMLLWGIILTPFSSYAASIQEKNKIITEHNAIRKSVKIPGLLWDNSLAKSAEQWAKKLATKKSFEHSNTSNGENLYIYWVSWQTLTSLWNDAVKSWGDEKNWYDITKNSCQKWKVCGHYTQIIWKNTKKVGCWKALYRDGDWEKVIWVCQYSPAGNYKGEKPY